VGSRKKGGSSAWPTLAEQHMRREWEGPFEGGGEETVDRQESLKRSEKEKGHGGKGNFPSLTNCQKRNPEKGKGKNAAGGTLKYKF